MKRSLSIESERQQTRNPAAVADTSPVSQAFVDNRESAAVQRYLMATMANSPQAIAQRQINQQIHNSPRMLAQRRMLSGESVQRVEEEEPLQKKVAENSPAQLEQQPSAKPNIPVCRTTSNPVLNRFPACPWTPSGFITTHPSLRN